MTLGIFDLLAILATIVLAAVISIIILFIAFSLDEKKKQKPKAEEEKLYQKKREEVLELLGNLQNSIDKFNENADVKYELPLEDKISLDFSKHKIKLIEEGLEPEATRGPWLTDPDDAYHEVNELKQLFERIDEHHKTSGNSKLREIEIKFTHKEESGGCAFLGEFDFAEFIIASEIDFEPSRKSVDDAIYKLYDASLQSFGKKDGVWRGSLGFIDDDAPEPNTIVTLTIQVDEEE